MSLAFQFSESLWNIGAFFPLNSLTEFHSEATSGWFFLCWKVFNNYLKCFYKSIYILFIISILAIYDFKQFVHSIYLLKNFFPLIFISWRLITLQYCSGFCHALTWISHGFTCIPHPDPPSHLPLHPIPLGLPSAPPRALVSCIQPGLVICFTLDNIHVLMLFSRNIPPSPSPTESKSLFCISIFKIEQPVV